MDDGECHVRQMIEALCGHHPEEVASHVCSAMRLGILSRNAGESILSQRIPDGTERANLVARTERMLDTLDVSAMRECADAVDRGLQKGVVLDPELQRSLMARSVRPDAYAELLAETLLEDGTPPNEAMLHLMLLERSGSVSREMMARVGTVLFPDRMELEDATAQARTEMDLIPKEDLERIDRGRQSDEPWNVLAGIR